MPIQGYALGNHLELNNRNHYIFWGFKSSEQIQGTFSTHFGTTEPSWSEFIILSSIYSLRFPTSDLEREKLF